MQHTEDFKTITLIVQRISNTFTLILYHVILKFSLYLAGLIIDYID